MTVRLSTGLRNHMLAAGSFKSAMDGCVLRIYGGAVPVTADASATGNTLLCSIYVNNSPGNGLHWDAAAVNGILSKAPSEVWSGTASGDGTATFFRFAQVGDDGAASTTEARVQGTVGLVAADLNLSSLQFSTGAPQTIDAFSMALPTY